MVRLNLKFAVLANLLLVGCGNSSPIQSRVDGKRSSEKVLFTAYSDSLISVAAINKSLGTDYSILDLGRPIGVSGTTFWLITVGGWHLNNRNILLQGTAFKESSTFYPNPSRKTEVEFEGPFSGLIRFDENSEQYSWLIEPGGMVNEFNYQGTLDYDLIILSESENGLQFLDVGTGKSFWVKDESKKMLDWSLDKNTNTVVVLSTTQSSEVETNIFPIDSMLRISITTNGNE